MRKGTSIRATNSKLYNKPSVKNSLKGKDDNEIQILDHQTLSKDDDYLPTEGAPSSDRCIYYLSYNVRRILKIG